jgi:hypothetical protein
VKSLLFFFVHLVRFARRPVRAACSAGQALASGPAVVDHLASDRLAVVEPVSIALFSAGSLATSYLRTFLGVNATLPDEVPVLRDTVPHRGK